MIKLPITSIHPIGNKLLCEIIPDKKVGLLELPEVMEHSGDRADHSNMSERDRAKIKEDRFKFLESDIALTVKLISKGPDVKWDVSPGDIIPIARTYIPDQAAIIENSDKKYIIFPATKDFILGFIKGE